MIAFDGVGIGAVISATAAALVSIIVALRQNGTVSNVRAIHEQVQTSNGKTLAEIVEGNDLTGVADHPPTPAP